MGNELGLLQSKESMNQHFYPVRYREKHTIRNILMLDRHQKTTNVSVTNNTYHTRIKLSQGPHFTFSMTKELLQSLENGNYANQLEYSSTF